MPRRLRSSSVRLILVTRTTGRCSSAPAAALATTSVMPAARRSGMMMAPAPAAWAVRMTAPRLGGSSTPSSRAIALGLGQNPQPVVEAIGEVRHSDHERDLPHLFVGKVLEHLLARRLRAGGAGQFAGIADGGALGRAEALVQPVL